MRRASPDTGTLAAANGWGPQAGSGDDRTPMGVHEGISCFSCHNGHNQNARGLLQDLPPARCLIAASTWRRWTRPMPTPPARTTSTGSSCADCHQHGIPKAKTPAPGKNG